MKTIITGVVVLLMLTTFRIAGQPLEDNFSFLKENMTIVKGKRTEFDQFFSQDANNRFLLTFSVMEVNKGDQVTMSVNAMDLNPNRVLFEPQRDLAQIVAQVKGGKKLVRVEKDGQLGNYDNKIVFYATGVEEARKLADVLKEIVKIANENDAIPPVKYSKQSLLENMVQTIGNVVINDDTYEQQFTFDSKNNNIVSYEINDVSKGETFQYVVNGADFNMHKIDFETKGNQVFVSFETKGSSKLIAYYKNGEQGNYVSGFDIKVASIEEARSLVKLAKGFVEKAEQEETVDFSGYSMVQCIAYLEKNIGQVVINQDAYEQELIIDTKETTFMSYKVEDVSKGETYNYSLNLADLNRGKTEYDTKGNAVFIYIYTEGGHKLIKTMQGEEQSNYTNSFEVRMPDIETARTVSEVLTRLKILAKEIMDNAISFSSVVGADSYILSAIGDLVINTNTFKQKIKKNNEECIFTYSINDISKDVLHDYEFNFRDIDLHKIHFDTKGTEVLVNMEVRGKNKLIKSYKNGDVDKYIYRFDIKTEDIEQARKLVAALKKKTENCTEQ
ncbi:MAG: hypothetical protein AAGI07_15000 [Bacteroidota bacterium]